MWCFILRIIDFIREFWKLLEFLLRKIEIFEIQNIFRIPLFTICFWFFYYFWNLFFYLPVYSCQNILKIFVLFYCMDHRFYHRILQNYCFFFKKFKIFEIQNFTKIPSFTIYFLFFSILDIFFFYFTYPKLSKNYRISCSVFYWKD